MAMISCCHFMTTKNAMIPLLEPLYLLVNGSIFLTVILKTIREYPFNPFTGFSGWFVTIRSPFWILDPLPVELEHLTDHIRNHYDSFL